MTCYDTVYICQFELIIKKNAILFVIYVLDGVSLQTAFMARKKDFIAKSLQRVVQAKEKAKVSQTDTRQIENQQHLTKTVSSYIKSRAVHDKQGLWIENLKC